MKIMHTANWHLGLTTEGVSRREEQQKVLDEICEIADSKQIDFVLVCGDVFCGINTPNYADELFTSTLLKLSNNGQRAVVIIAGNNDVSEKFVAYRNFALTRNIFLINDLNTDFEEEYLPKLSPIKLVSKGKGYLTLQKGGERLCIAFMPYPSNYFSNEKTLEGEDKNDKLKRIFASNATFFDHNCFNVAMAHFFVPYKNVTKDFYFESRLDVFPARADYVALGHVHDFVEVDEGKNIYYSGGIIQCYEKESSNKCVIVLDVKNNKIESKEFVKLKTPKKFVKVIGSSFEEICSKLDGLENCLVKIYLGQETISSQQIKEIYKKYPCVIACVLIPKTKRPTFKFASKKITNEELLTNFYRKEYAKKPNEKVVQIFCDLLKEGQDETN